MANPLVAEREDSTQSYSGIQIAESVADTQKAIESGDWAGGVLGAVGTGLDALGMALDPFGAIFSAGVGWLIEHVGPVSDALDSLTGDPDEIKAHSETWKNVSAELEAINTEMKDLVKADTASWLGEAGDAYRKRSEDTANLIAAAKSAADGAADGIGTAGEVVAAVRTLVRDIIAELVGHLISWALQVVCTLGIALAWVVPQVVAEVAKVAAKIADITTKLIQAMKKLSPLLKKLGDSFGDTKKALDKIKADNTKNDGPASTKAASASGSGSRSLDGGGPPSNNRNHDDNLQNQSGDSQTPNRDANKRRCETDPVDIASGEMVLSQTDAEISAVLPLIVRRTHLSSYRVGRFFGASWASTLDQRLEVGDVGVSFTADDGKLLYTPKPGPGQTTQFEGSPNTLTRHDDGGYAVVLADEAQVLHFAPGDRVLQLTAIADRNRNVIRFEYDEAGLPNAVRHSAGFQIGVDTEDGLVAALYLVGGDDGEDLPLMRYAYTGGRLTSVINASGQALKFDYDETGRITGWTDRNGIWYRYTYDHEGRCVRTEGAGGFLNGTFEYAGDVTRFTDSLGHTKVFHLNGKKQAVREIDALGNATVSEWDDHDRLLSRTDPLGRTVRYEYNDAGDVTAVTGPDGGRQLIEYNDQRMPVTIIDPDGAVSRREYDENGNVTKVTDPVGAVTTYGYDERGSLASITDPLGNVRRIETDEAGLPVSISNPLGATTTYRRDGFGRVTEVTDPVGGTTRLGWTVDGQATWQTLPDGSSERWLYDGEGNIRTQVDRLGQTTTTETTAFDLPSVEVGPDGGRREFRYDTETRLVSVTNEQGQVWQYEHDPAGNVVRESDFDGRVISYAYDAAGQLVERTNGAGETVRFTYDLLGNVVERRSATTTAFFTYDALGRLTSAKDDVADVTFQRDQLGRVVAETVNGRTVTSAYDALGRRVRRRTPSGAESVWEYAAGDRPISLHTGGRTLAFDYDAAGREVRRTLGSAAVLSQSWNADHQLAGQSLISGAGRPLQQRSYTYRADGVLTGIDDQLRGPRTFDLDGLGRVTAVHGRQWTERYVYDRAGNLAQAAWPAGPGSVDSAAIGDRDYVGSLISRAGNTRYDHDAEGRVTTRSLQPQAAWHYTWSPENRLTGVVTPDGQRWRYVYDPLGRRIAKQRLRPDGGIAEHIDFTWDDNRLIEQVHNGTKSIVWEFEPDSFRVLTQTERQTTPNTPQQWVDQRFHAIVTDLIGTPTEMVDPNGDLAWHLDTTLWGNLKASAGNAWTPLRFPGQYHDHETGLHYNLNRYYDPITGRYTSHDPLGLAPKPNTRAYVANPTGWSDPLGLMDCQGPGSRDVKLDNPQLRPNPTKPEWMYRGDERHHEEIFKNGFTSWGKNYDMPHHVHGGRGTTDSGYVSVTPSNKAADQFVVQKPPLGPEGPHKVHGDKIYPYFEGQVYKIQPTGNMIRMASQGDGMPQDLVERMQHQAEWDAVRHVDPRNIESVTKYSGYMHQGPVGTRTPFPGTEMKAETFKNPNFVPDHPGYDPHADARSGFDRNTDLGLKPPGDGPHEIDLGDPNGHFVPDSGGGHPGGSSTRGDYDPGDLGDSRNRR